MPALGTGDRLLFYAVGSTIILLLWPFRFALLVNTLTLIAGVYYTRYERSYWKRHGVPSTHATLLFGNTHELKDGQHALDLKYLKELGPTFGLNTFDRPELITKDLEFLNTVMVKEFSRFEDRMFSDGNNDSPIRYKSLSKNNLLMLQGAEWKRVRSVVTSAFTSAKLSRLIPIMQGCADDFSRYIEKFVDEDKEIPLKDAFGRFTLDVIARAGFSFDAHTYDRDVETEFMRHSKSMVDLTAATSRAVILAFFPFLKPFIERYTGKDIMDRPCHDYFTDFTEVLYRQRTQESGGVKQSDMMQMLLDAERSENDDGGDKGSRKTLNRIEVLAMASGLLVAGYETTASTLQFALYQIAHTPEVQERALEEIEEVIGDSEQITYEQIKKLQYLDQVIAETLRLYPPTARLNRLCKEHTTIQGITLEPGTIVTIPVYAVHHDPEHYPEPEKFDPERFTPEEKARRHPLAYLPWGYGPRNCLGMRFADFEMRIALVVLLKKYRFVPVEGSPGLPVEVSTKALTNAVHTLTVRAERR
ncbi:cytochrome P450 3A24-like protein [Aphelenchoides avenae]|nr:cytochrome P450 3A24-like protein [Aphelenchus avenae]